MNRLVYTVGMVFVFGSVVGADDPAKPAVVQAKSIPLREFAHTFATNEARADALYMDKQVTVTGVLRRVLKTNFRTPKDQPDTGKNAYEVQVQSEEIDGVPVVVHFFFDKGERDRLADLQVGQEVTIQGSCRSAYRGVDSQPGGKEFVRVTIYESKLLPAK